MNPVFVVSMPADEKNVRNIVGALSESGIDIFWERTPPGSRQWTSAAKRILAGRGIILIWSSAAAAGSARRYQSLARRAIATGLAICVRLDNAELPADFDGCTMYDLRGWRSRASSLFMLDLIAAAQAKAAGLDPPLPRAPRQLLLKRLALIVPSVIAVVALVAGLYRDFGIDRIAGPREAAAWAARRPHSCEDLRTFLRNHSDGAHAAEAQALLDGRSIRNRIHWFRVERALPLSTSYSNGAGQVHGAAVERDTFERVRQEGIRRCRRFAGAISARFLEARLRLDPPSCERFASETSCELRGEALCQYEEPESVPIETCG